MIAYSIRETLMPNFTELINNQYLTNNMKEKTKAGKIKVRSFECFNCGCKWKSDEYEADPANQFEKNKPNKFFDSCMECGTEVTINDKRSKNA